MSAPARRPLIAFYGDDFTGSTDALEALTFAGLRAVLFTGVPAPAELARYAGHEAIGIAGTSRAQGPDWMRAHLPAAFRALAGTGARIVQYKVCSTFDSAPHVGSIGTAIDIGMEVTGSPWSPSVIGAPALGRWQVFGHLFAAADGRPWRIDRHPTMSRHPVTPMAESDLRLHLGRQTARGIELIDFVALGAGRAGPIRAAAAAAGRVVFIDVLDAASQLAAGRLVWEDPAPQLFSASSSGLNHALVAWWRQAGLLPATPPPPAGRPSARQLMVVSGSCSPLTARQIAAAEVAGFAALRLDVQAAADPDRRDAEIARVAAEAGGPLAAGRHVVVYAARTVDDPAFRALPVYCEGRGITLAEGQRGIGRALGGIARRLVEGFGLRRLLVAGGDSSGLVVGALPVKALEADRPLCPGLPICRATSDAPAFDGLEMILKGGQIGDDALFVTAAEA